MTTDTRTARQIADAARHAREDAFYAARRAALAALPAPAYVAPVYDRAADSGADHDYAADLAALDARTPAVAVAVSSPIAHRDCPRCGTPIVCCDCAERAGR